MTTVMEKRLTEAKNYEDEGNFVEALKAYRDVYASDPHSQEAILGLGRVAYTIGEVECAFDFFVKLLIENHEHAWGYWGRAAVFFAYEQPERALREVARALEYDRPATSLRIDCAVLLNENGYFEEARCALAALSKEAYDEDADIEWCYASLRCGTPDAYTLSRLAAHEPSLDETTAEAEWLLLHGLHKRLHDVEASRVLIARALELDPELAARAEFAD